MADVAICCIEGCYNPVLNLEHQWCSKHYQRWRRTGDPQISRIDREQTGKPCKVPECGKPSGYKGYCYLHYDRVRRTGDPNVASLSPKHRSHYRWLEEHKSHVGDECLIWPFYRGPNGRGVFGDTSAPHAMCVEAHGNPPTPEHEAAHSCGRGHEGCVNPRHLRWATAKENEADKVLHGTLRRGTDINTNKLSENDVRQIRSSTNESGVSLAKRFGVTPAQISSIRRRRSWDWLD